MTHPLRRLLDRWHSARALAAVRTEPLDRRCGVCGGKRPTEMALIPGPDGLGHVRALVCAKHLRRLGRAS